MRFSCETIVALLLLSSTTPTALAAPAPQPITDIQLITSEEAAGLDARQNAYSSDINDLWKRKGGGGGGGKGGSGSSSGSSSSGSSSSGSSSSGGKGGSSSSGSSAGRGSSSSSTGGSTKTGSGPAPAFAGNRYAGGATAPYAAGGRTSSGISPILLGAGIGGVAAIAFWPHFYAPYGLYSYPYNHPYTFRNHSATNGTNTTSTVATRQEDAGVEQTRNVTCFCAQYQECSCDDTGNYTYLDQIIGNGDYNSLNKTVVNVAEVNGSTGIFLNGTLPNGTTSSGGTESASAGIRAVTQASGYWVMVALVVCTCWFA